MNKALTDGFELMPPPFAAGLEVWSQGDGTPGTPRWTRAETARLVPSDAEFGACLELTKAAGVTRLRYTGETPILPGCYLRVSARVKVLSGPLPAVRIGGWAGGVGGAHVGGVVEHGPLSEIDAYGAVVEVSAIVGSGTRGGVDMPWGCRPLYGHFGVEFTGAPGAVIRVDDLRIEDVTTLYLRRMMDWVDVRDFGARGDGHTDDSAAFRAADAAAGGRRVLVPDGLFWLGADVTLMSETRFQGRVRMPEDACLTLRRTFNLDTYCDAFGEPVLALRKAVQCLLRSADHGVLDLCGRTIELTEPLDLSAAAGAEGSATRRVLRNGRFECLESPDWTPVTVTAKASYAAQSPFALQGIKGADRIAPGSLVEGAGVGREVYVRSVDADAGRVILSHPLHGAPGRARYSFRRFRYALDFSGFGGLSDFGLQGVELRLNGRASGLLLAPEGTGFAVEGCDFAEPRDRGITSPGGGCRSLRVERCQFLSSEIDLSGARRRSIGINLNGGGARIRDNRAVRFAHFLVAQGTGHVIDGNQILQGGGVVDGTRGAGVVLTSATSLSRVTGNRFETCGLEWTSEHEAVAVGADAPCFGGLAVTGNMFAVEGADPTFRFIRITPFGGGQGLSGLGVVDNLFSARAGQIARVEEVGSGIAVLDADRVRGVSFDGNIFDGVAQETVTRVSLPVVQAREAAEWELETAGLLPLGMRVGCVVSLVLGDAVTTRADRHVAATPAIHLSADAVRLIWPEPCKGRVQVTLGPAGAA